MTLMEDGLRPFRSVSRTSRLVGEVVIGVQIFITEIPRDLPVILRLTALGNDIDGGWVAPVPICIADVPPGWRSSYWRSNLHYGNTTRLARDTAPDRPW